MTTCVRIIELNLYGFDDLPSALDRIPAAVHVRVVKKGDLLPSKGGIYKENSIAASIEVARDDRYCERLANLVEAFGGEAALSALLKHVRPHQKWVRYIIPAMTSPDNEEGYLDRDSIELLHRLELELQFWFC